MGKRTNTAPRRSGSPQPDRRRALELLAASRDGCTEAIMIAHGFTVRQLGELVRAGLATAYTRRVIVARRTGEIASVRVPAAGPRGGADRPRLGCESAARLVRRVKAGARA